MLEEKKKKIFIKKTARGILKLSFFSGKMNKNILEKEIFKNEKIKSITFAGFDNGETINNDNTFRFKYIKEPKLESIKSTLSCEKIKENGCFKN